MELERKVNIECVFCGSHKFLVPYEGYIPHENELLQCSNCGRINDFSVIRDLKIEEIKREVLLDAKKELEKAFKKAFR